uniref:Uncharacterized protein n=1 Tax=Amorphochlora amoebiformis TaxID=1561963 RepID=A0A7S0D4D8_9EUKA
MSGHDEEEYTLAFRPLMLAAAINPWALEYFLQDGPEEVNKQSKGSLTAAVRLAHSFDHFPAKALEKYQHMDDDLGLTPLMLAVLFGPVDNVLCLLRKKADCTKKTTTGRTALDFARLVKDESLIQMIGRKVKMQRSLSIAKLNLKMERVLKQSSQDEIQLELRDVKARLKNLDAAILHDSKLLKALERQLKETKDKIDNMKRRKGTLSIKEQQLKKLVKNHTAESKI